MTEKRFRYEGAQIFDDDEFLCCTLSIWKEQLVDLLNDLHEENIKLHIQNDFLKDENQHMRDLVNENEQLKKENNQLELQNSTLMKEVAEYSRKAKELEKENEKLKSELSRYKEVNRLDIWKSSYSSEDALITELQMKCDKKQEHIVLLENKIHRMREAIHKLEWLASHRNANLIRENEQLKQENQELRKYLSWQDMELEEMEDL